MHYTAMDCHALHDNGLSCITRQGFVMHYTVMAVSYTHLTLPTKVNV